MTIIECSKVEFMVIIDGSKGEFMVKIEYSKLTSLRRKQIKNDKMMNMMKIRSGSKLFLNDDAVRFSIIFKCGTKGFSYTDLRV